ncbi:carboxylesterase [Holotrichia oblita]|uniref:Carboxylesterase n=1 Tax=Holotrichia oblita TaxID=644536 RepID=A0ACB9T760_HOLOL|nr:carboxylesterase [Holotrichia oblita]
MAPTSVDTLYITRLKRGSPHNIDGDSDHQGDIEGTELLDQKDKEKPDDSLMNQPRVKLPNPFRKSRAMDDDVEKGSEPKEKKKFVDSICLPLVSVFPKKKKDEQNLETQTAGLASVETLDDNDKSADKNDDSKNRTLNDKEEIEKSSCKDSIKAYRVVISALFIFVLLVIIIVMIAIPGKHNILHTISYNDVRTETITSCGKVKGIQGNSYALPPLNNLRFKSAQPLDNISYCWNETYLAYNSTDSCIQIHGDGTVTGTEDCLTLDVITPYVRYYSPLPVIVMIGADSFLGESPGKMRPSTRYARSKDVVFVRPNFRLGTLGFLATKSLSDSDYPHISGNYALSDIMQALEWVRLNIEHFGGNSSAVTLFGHRAGATLVTALATMPGKKNFARAWATSGGAIFPTKSLGKSEKDNDNLLTAIPCPISDFKCLRDADAYNLMSSIPDTWRKPHPDLPEKGEDPKKRHEWLVLDGKILPDQSLNNESEVNLSPVPLVLGTTAHASSTEKLLNKYTTWSEELVVQHVKDSLLGDLKLAEDVLNIYPKTYKGLSAMISDIRTICPLYEFYTRTENTFFYVVTQTRGPEDIADIDSDVDAILGRYEPKTPEQRRYFTSIQQLFYHYVWHGKIDEKALYGRNVLIVEQDVRAESKYSQCDFWIEKNLTAFGQLD